MIQNIFLVKGENLRDIDTLSIYNYPEEVITKDRSLIDNIFYAHLNQASNINGFDDKKFPFFHIDAPAPQVINNMNVSTICINGHIIIGLIYDEADNPYDYNDIFKELVYELLNNERCCSFKDDSEIETLLITLFIDFRRYAEENIEKNPQMELIKQSSFIKVFLFGIENVGKSSLVRRIKTGEFTDNYFTPTRKFNIEYIEDKEKGLLAFWDMPGQYLFRKKWLIGLQDSNIVVYMIDVSNQIRFAESKKELYSIINRYELSGIPLLVIGNKVDLINHFSQPAGVNGDDHVKRLKNEIFEYFNFNEIENRKWNFLFTSVKTNYNMNKIIKNIIEMLP